MPSPIELDLSPSWFEPPRDVVLLAIPPAKLAAADATFPKPPYMDPIALDLIFEFPLCMPPNTPYPNPTIGGFPSTIYPFAI